MALSSFFFYSFRSSILAKIRKSFYKIYGEKCKLKYRFSQKYYNLNMYMKYISFLRDIKTKLLWRKNALLKNNRSMYGCLTYDKIYNKVISFWIII